MRISLMTAAFLEIQAALVPLFDALDSEPRQARLLAMVGYAPDAVSGTNLRTLVESLQTGYADLQILLTTPAKNLVDLKEQLGKVQDLLRIIADLKDLLASSAPAATATGLVHDLTIALFGNYLQGAHPTLYALLVLLEIVEDPADHESELPVYDTNNQFVRAGYRAYYFYFNRLGALFSDPAGYIKERYYPTGLPDRATANTVADKLFPRLGQFLLSIGVHASYGMSANETLSYGVASDELQQHMLTIMVNQGRIVACGFTLALSSAQDGDLGLVIAPFGTATFHHDFADWVVNLLLTASINGVAIGPQGVLLDGGGSFGATASITSQPNDAGNAFLFGAPEGTHLAIGEVAFKANLQASTTAGADYGVLVQATKAKFVLRPEEGDGFLSSIIPADGVSGAFDLGLGWSKTKGFYLLGGAALKAHYTITNTAADKLLVIRGVDVGLAASADKLLLSATASGRVKLGPVQAELTDIGAVAVITFPGSGGNLGVANAEIGFKYPAGVGIQVDSDLVTGGGYLFLDAANHKYAGAATLTLQTGSRDINLNALGLLQTQLPTNPDAYSLLLLITASFAPIQLGLGFTLNGVGGLVGVNRAANTDLLRGLVRSGGLSQLLFPANVLDNPAGALALVDTAFPATEGRYLIGLLGQLGWGVPTSIITLDVALLVELPAPVRLVLLGVLQAMLPSQHNDVLKLRADFLGTVDFGARKAAFDAALSDSHLLQFALSGDLAFRLYQGSNPVFLITAGGFHPAFQPPAGAELPSLRRLTLALSQGDELQLSLASYFAVTSNTVQFGAHLDLYLRLRLGLHVDGHFGFDVLFQFNPFQVLAHVEAGVAIKRGNSELLGLHLALDVSGPGPWHVWGEASFRLWFVKIRVGVDATLGSKAAPQPIAAPKVHELLSAALQAPASWEVAAPSTSTPSGVVLRPAASQAGRLFLDPRGSLALRQRVVPLGVTIDKYGSGPAKPQGGQRFDVTSLWVGEQAYAGEGVEVVSDFFAPDQFRRLSEAQKLSLPSFQLLPSGWRLKSLAGLQGAATATRRVVAYEQLLVEGPNTGTASGGATSAGMRKLSAASFRQLARNGALGQAYQATQPSARAPRPVGWSEDTYAVVNAADLSLYQGQNHFGSQVEAEQYRVAQHDATELLVVPTYQLELA
jgi:hypothetical protein